MNGKLRWLARIEWQLRKIAYRSATKADIDAKRVVWIRPRGLTFVEIGYVPRLWLRWIRRVK